MRSKERRKGILETIQARGGISLGEIAERFGVSKMTAHRDLEQLEGRGLVRRIFGGAVPAADRTMAASAEPTQLVAPEATRHTKECLVCLRPVNPPLLYSLTLAGGEQRHACCAHCGLAAHLLFAGQVRMAMATDFLGGKPHPAHRSRFVMGSAAVPCCHPSILCFESEEMAQRFRTGFGGTVGGLAEALEFLRQEMSGDGSGESCPHCAGKDS